MDDAINIALCFDIHYAPHAAAVIASVVRNAPSARLRFIVLHSGVNQAVRSRIETIAPNALFWWTEVNDSNWPAFAERVNRATLFRFALETLAPADCRRVIYLDTDVIVMRDVSELWRFDLGLSPVGAVIDYYATVAGPDGKLLNDDIDPLIFAARWKLSPPSSYFNAGVLLINLDAVRAKKLFSAAIKFMAEHERDLPFKDQDALNWVLWGQWCCLPVAWNVQRYMPPGVANKLAKEKRLINEMPAVIHFIHKDKPWLPTVWHPWAWVYWDNLARTSFTTEVARTYGVKLRHRLRFRLKWFLRRPRAVRELRA